MTYFSIVLGQIITFILYAAIGILAVKAKVINKDGLGVMSKFITKIALPLLIFTNTINGATRKQFLGAVPIMLATALMYLLLYLLALLNTALTKTGAISTPLAMIYLGGIFCYTDIPKYLKKAEIYGTVILKMCIFPSVFFYLLKLIPGITQDIAVTMSVLSALPTMTSIAMLAQIQKSADAYSAGMIFVTTLFSIVTLPLVCLCIG